MTTVQLYFALRREYGACLAPNMAWEFAMQGERFCRLLFTRAIPV